jgi:hypothetical protein
MKSRLAHVATHTVTMTSVVTSTLISLNLPIIVSTLLIINPITTLKLDAFAPYHPRWPPSHALPDHVDVLC